MLEFLSRDQVEKIHAASLRILEEVGAVVYEDSFLKFLADSGVSVDFDEKRAKIPSSLVTECIKKTPKRMTLHARDAKHDVELEEGKIYAHALGGAATLVDLDSGEVRPSTRKDVVDLTRMIDALPNIHTCTMVALPCDIPEQIRDIFCIAEQFQNTGKNLDATPFSSRSFPYMIELAEAIVGDKEKLRKRPIITCSLSPTSPLKFSGDVVEIMVQGAKLGLPMAVLPCPMAGATSPVTLAGSLVQQNAETLAGLVMIQLVNAGTPFMYCPRVFPIDMQSGMTSSGVEVGLMSAGCVQLAKYYGFPSDVYGLDTSSKNLDEQVAFEKALNGILPALAGANMLSGAGCIEGAITVSYEQLVIDDEIFGMIFRAVKGIQVDKDRLAVDIIAKVSRESSNFLQQMHTLKHIRQEYYLPKLSDRTSRSRWRETGSKSIVEVAREKARRILAEHKPPPLEKDVMTEIKRILKRATNTLMSAKT
ncbi:MAG: trimethylamine methyltransferase family protein [Candidatus Bathyarchaeota archaeon]|jgi:trimethylamine--corrinoid protein Co-methyltransferase